MIPFVRKSKSPSGLSLFKAFLSSLWSDFNPPVFQDDVA